MRWVALVAGAYLLGSVSFSYVIVRAMTGRDVRMLQEQPDQQRALAYGIVGAAEAAGRAWATGKLPIEPNRLAVEIAELAWSGLRGISRH